MNRDLGLKVLSEIMGWDEEEARPEFRWLSFMSAYKYDGYRDYLAGARFVERLAVWLQQFDKDDRNTAYKFVKQRLVYFSPAEIIRLVEQFFPEYVEPELAKDVAKSLGIETFEIFSCSRGINEYKSQRRRTLFMALSDGARIDTLRRANVKTIVNDQVVLTTQINASKWTSLLESLAKDLKKITDVGADEAKFSRVYLIDDLTASGTSFLRDPMTTGNYEGKLVKFAESLSQATKDLGGCSPFVQDFTVTVHHYIGSYQAKQQVHSMYEVAREFLTHKGLPHVDFTFGLSLPADIRIVKGPTEPFARLCEKYYDPAIEGERGEHGEQSGTKDKMFGYALCGLPLVMEHNTPNNSVPLIWAETFNDNGHHNMVPLFRRRERHSDMAEGITSNDSSVE